MLYLYILHGAGGSYASLIRDIPLIKKYADNLNLMLVLPDGGKTGWYFASPIDAQMQYETYISSELIIAIDKNYNTAADKSMRAITGLSMGGHAFYLMLCSIYILNCIR